MMKIALFGATGGTGREVLQQALAAGYDVKVLARTPANLNKNDDNLSVIAGNVLKPEPVQECVAGTDAVICVLGTRQGDEPVEAAGTAQIIEAMQTEGVRRLVVVTSLGVGDSKKQVPMFFRALMKTVLRKVMAAKEEQEKLIQESGLDWIIVRPGGLTDGPKTGSYTAGLDKSITGGQVARADVADFVLKQLHEDTFLRQTPAIT